MTLRRFSWLAGGLLLVVALVVGQAWSPSAAEGSGLPKPVLTGIAVDAAALSHLGGTVTVTAATTNAATCTLKSNHAVTGLPSTVPCTGSSVAFSVQLRGDTGRNPVGYKLTLTASGHGRTTAKVIVMVNRNPLDCTQPGPGQNLAGCTIPIYSYVDLSGADLTGATLMGSGMADVKLSSAVLTGATVEGIQLVGEPLVDAVVSGTQFGSTTMQRISSGGIQGMAASLPSQWRQCGGYLVGPTADLHGADLHGLTCPGVFVFDNLTGADVAGADFTGASFYGAVGLGLVGSPAALPAGFGIVGGLLVGPGVSLVGADVTGLDLSPFDLSDVRSGSITGTPAALPANWGLVAGYLVGPGADLVSAALAGADLAGADLTDANLGGADLTGADLAGVVWSDTLCPDGSNSDVDGGTCVGHFEG